MKNILILLSAILLTGLTNISAADITIFIYSPRQNEIIDTLLYVDISIQSTYEIQYITASVEDRQTTLVYSDGRMRGTINLNGMLRGIKILNIKAVDVFSNEVNKSLEIIYDRKPVLDILSPVQNDLASPVLNINLTYQDDNISGSMIQVLSDDEILFTKTGSFDTTVDFSSYREGSHILKVSAYDSLFQNVEITRSFQIVKSPGLLLEYFLQYPVFDIDSSRILSGSGKFINIKNYKTGESENITLPRDLFVRRMYLIKDGFLGVLEQESAYLYDSVYEWKNGTLTNLGETTSIYSLVVRDKWAIWNRGTTLLLRNNDSGLVVTVADNTVNVENDLTRDGLVAYGSQNPDYQIFSYINGQTKQLTFYGMNTYPLTDGNNFLYRRAGSPDTLFLNDGTDEIPLSSGYMNPKSEYDINKGWIAYCKTGEIGQQHIWLRNPQGEERKITYFGTDSRIMQLNGDGQCVYKNQDNVYISDYSGNIKRFTSLLYGTPVWLENEFYYISVNAIFRVDTSLTGIENNEQSGNPGFAMLQNYPNPFNNSTIIKYSIPVKSRVDIRVYNTLGQLVKQLKNEIQSEGDHQIIFDAKGLASGIYLYTLTSEAEDSKQNYHQSGKMVLMK